MKPVEFKEMNTVLNKPDNMTDDECQSLPCFRDGQQTISKWELDEAEKKHVAEKGYIWIRVLAGPTSPPILPEAEETVFISEGDC